MWTTKKKKIRKIDSNGNFVEWNERLRRFEPASRAWGWDDITPGYIRESKRNYKANN